MIQRGSEWEKNSISPRTILSGGRMPICAGQEDTGGPVSMGRNKMVLKRKEMRAEQGSGSPRRKQTGSF